MKIAIIPARGGSKRIPRKNIKLFCGKPMIAWSIEAAIESNCFDRILVSTDDKEIASISEKYGAEVPFTRPSTLSDDYTATTPVINHAINWQKANGVTPTKVCCIYATAPFISASDISKGLMTLENSAIDFAFSVTSYAFPIQRAIRIDSDKRIHMFDDSKFNVRSQDLEEAFHDAGQFYWGVTDAWLEERMVFGPKSAPVILPRHRVQDIDTHEDWARAEWMFKALKAEAHAENEQ